MTRHADPVRRIADAVLYEGYILWPYRRPAMKNRQRWTFGGVYPRAHSDGRDDDPWTMETQCLVEGDADAAIDVEVRFLHVVERQVGRYAGGELVAWGDPGATLAATLGRIADGAELLTCIAGDGPPLGRDAVEAHVPDGVEVEYHEGGQPAWWWLLCAE